MLRSFIKKPVAVGLRGRIDLRGLSVLLWSIGQTFFPFPGERQHL